MTEPAVTVNILRSGDPPGAARYQVEFEDHMTVMRVLERTYRELDSTLAFRHYCCKSGRCGSCVVKVNGKNVFGCKERVLPGAELFVEPADRRRAIRDLVIDFATAAERRLPARPLDPNE